MPPSDVSLRVGRSSVRRCLTACLLLCAAIPAIAIAQSQSSFNPTLLVNTESFQTIDRGDNTTDVELRFGGDFRNRVLYDVGNSRFRTTQPLLVYGNLTVTGSAIIGNVRGNIAPETTLEVVGTVSGAILSVGGNNVVISVASFVFNENSLDADFRIESDGNANMLFVDGGTNRVGIGTNVPDTVLDIIGTLSGSLAQATAVNALQTFEGSGLADCDTGATSKLLWDATTKRFSCGTDQTGGGGGDLSMTFADTRYVNVSGDTMTGKLLIDLTSGTDALEVIEIVSGSVMHIGGANVTISNIAFIFNDNSLDADFRIESDGNANMLFVDGGTNRVGIGTNVPDTVLDIIGTLSGSLAQATAVNALQTFEGSGLADCDTGATSKLLWDATTKRFSCGTDQGGGGMSLTRINGNSGAAGTDMTWQNLTSNSADCTTTALCASAITTTGVGVGTWRFKYTLIYQTAATTTGIGFAINHTGTAGQYQAMWTHITTGGAAATGIGDNDTATAAGQLAEGKHEGVLNALIGSATAGVATANADIMAVLEGIIVITGSGNLELKLGSEVAASAVRIMADSTLELLRIE